MVITANAWDHVALHGIACIHTKILAITWNYENTWNVVKLREIHRKYVELREIEAQGGRMNVPSARTGQPGAGRRRWATPECRLTTYNTIAELNMVIFWQAGAHQLTDISVISHPWACTQAYTASDSQPQPYSGWVGGSGLVY